MLYFYLNRRNSLNNIKLYLELRKLGIKQYPGGYELPNGIRIAVADDVSNEEILEYLKKQLEFYEAS
jgi:histidinol-phosphate/aromatic aminotransferase/cobyric acid decarboxylase-like protein